MSARFNHPLVSDFEQGDLHSREMHEHRGRTTYRHAEMRDFVTAVCEALGGASHYNCDNNTAFIYRPGDTHVLGEIGFADLRLRKVGKEKLAYYVRTTNIHNPKVSTDNWKHNTVSTDKLSTAVKLAVNHLKPLDVRGAVAATAAEVKAIITKDREVLSRCVRDTLSKLLGFHVYSNNEYEKGIFKELRNITFASEELNRDKDKLFSDIDAVTEFDRYIARGLTYVAFSDNYGQLVADSLHLEPDAYITRAAPIRVAATELPEWAQARTAVLKLVSNNTHVQGVGVRVDDRVFYICTGEYE
jgi:hypothetical protein